MWDAGAVVYWFRLVRGKDGVDWVPYKADGESGIGRQVIVHDINEDGLPDIAAGGMKGAHVLLHRQRECKPVAVESGPASALHRPDRAARARQAATFDETSGKVAGASKARRSRSLSATAGKTATQKMANFRPAAGAAASSSSGAAPNRAIGWNSSSKSPSDGSFGLAAAFTMARDYANRAASCSTASRWRAARPLQLPRRDQQRRSIARHTQADPPESTS